MNAGLWSAEYRVDLAVDVRDQGQEDQVTDIIISREIRRRWCHPSILKSLLIYSHGKEGRIPALHLVFYGKTIPI